MKKAVFDVSLTRTGNITPRKVRLHITNTAVHYPQHQVTIHSCDWADFDPALDRFVEPGDVPAYVLAVFSVDGPDLACADAIFNSLANLATQEDSILGGGFEVKAPLKEKAQNGT